MPAFLFPFHFTARSPTSAGNLNLSGDCSSFTRQPVHGLVAPSNSLRVDGHYVDPERAHDYLTRRASPLPVLIITCGLLAPRVKLFWSYVCPPGVKVVSWSKENGDSIRPLRCSADSTK